MDLGWGLGFNAPIRGFQGGVYWIRVGFRDSGWGLGIYGTRVDDFVFLVSCDSSIS